MRRSVGAFETGQRATPVTTDETAKCGSSHAVVALHPAKKRRARLRSMHHASTSTCYAVDRAGCRRAQQLGARQSASQVLLCTCSSLPLLAAARSLERRAYLQLVQLRRTSCRARSGALSASRMRFSQQHNPCSAAQCSHRRAAPHGVLRHSCQPAGQALTALPSSHVFCASTGTLRPRRRISQHCTAMLRARASERLCAASSARARRNQRRSARAAKCF